MGGVKPMCGTAGVADCAGAMVAGVCVRRVAVTPEGFGRMLRICDIWEEVRMPVSRRKSSSWEWKVSDCDRGDRRVSLLSLWYILDIANRPVLVRCLVERHSCDRSWWREVGGRWRELRFAAGGEATEFCTLLCRTNLQRIDLRGSLTRSRETDGWLAG